MKDLPNVIEIAVGMKVMVTSNIETDLDLANGARGEIVDIILDPDEPPIEDSLSVSMRLREWPVQQSSRSSMRGSGIAYRRSRSDLPLIPFLPLLLLKLQAWMDHGEAEKFYLRVKQYVDVQDIGDLLELAVGKYNVDLKKDGKWLPESFVRAAAKRVKAYVKSYSDSAEHWRDIGFAV
ncbi:hypothetical protein C8R44DRAFT_987416 [Mycena epipterygia]|nr:hypothetical protein C8R44DRAFT_987416 [Mycena epipterygia]